MLLRFIRFLLFPLSIIYAIIVFFRNLLYNFSILSIYKIPIKSICVGNLSTGGTGKSPLVMYIAEKFYKEFNLAILSRGYGRNTRGYLDVDESKNSFLVGDEPLMFFYRFKNLIKVAVSENRKNGIIKLIENYKINLLILDDAFQHRKVKSGFCVLLNDYNNPIHKDFLLPVGNLREARANICRADIMLITKCPNNLSQNKKNKFIKSYKLNPDNIYFSNIEYQDFVPFFSKSNIELKKVKKIILVTGIANPIPIIEFLEKDYELTKFIFKDHYEFKIKDIEDIHKKFDTFASCDIRIVCTEKDFVRLKQFYDKCNMEKYPWFYLPIKIQIDRENEFFKKIDKYVRSV